MIRRLVPVIALAVAGCGGGPAAPVGVVPGGDAPITRERLAGARLREIREPIEWTFSLERFTLDCPAGPLPADLADTLLAPGAKESRIGGRWRIDEARGELVLTEIGGGERRGPDGPVVLPIRGAGTVRCDLGERQYNVFKPDHR